MLGFLGMDNTPEEKKLGTSITTRTKNIPEQLEELKGKVDKTLTKNKTELQKFRELSKFNQQLSKSYAMNLKIIVDISNLLQGYNEFFEMFKTKLAEIDRELGIPISSDDFNYLKTLTMEQMMNLDATFKRETGNLKRLYSRYGKQREYDEVDSAEKQFDLVKQQGQSAYGLLRSGLSSATTTTTTSQPSRGALSSLLSGGKKGKKAAKPKPKKK